jgi:hypothetical protein
MTTTAKRAALFINTIGEFSKWASANVQNVDLEECHSIYEDFVKSNEHIIAKINKLRFEN